jgi:class 3 adenylate cyclase
LILSEETYRSRLRQSSGANRMSRVIFPSGTITFLFTDMEGSTKLWEQYPEAMKGTLAQHDAILRAVVEAHETRIIKTLGDGIHAAFDTAAGGAAAAVAAQRALFAEGGGDQTASSARPDGRATRAKPKRVQGTITDPSLTAPRD